jgi:hypothetical protein
MKCAKPAKWSTCYARIAFRVNAASYREILGVDITKAVERAG